jgi:hypothetical protein
MNSNAAEIRRQQRRAENAARPRPVTQVVQIGDRANNGRYNVIQKDGGIAAGKAIKSFDAAHQSGQVVSAIERKDGAIVLNGPKAFREPTAADNPLALPALEDNCDGYINGQIFNCGADKRTLTIVWAIGKQGESYQLLNLITGESYTMGSAAATIQPCATTGTTPFAAPSEPLVEDGEWYLHVWLDGDWAFPTTGRCGNPAPPFHPQRISSVSEIRFDLLGPDGRRWTTHSAFGSLPGFQNWQSHSISVRTQDPTPPPRIGTTLGVSYPILAAYQGGSTVFGSAAGAYRPEAVYVTAACPSSNTAPTPITTPRDTGQPPIPNTIEHSLSIGPDFGPIGYLRHTPSCVLLGRWDFSKSFRVLTSSRVEVNGQLSQDWRYGPTFTCRDTFKGEHWINVDDASKTKLWEIEPADRPTTLTPGTPQQIKITEKTIEPNCTTTIVKTNEITAIVTGNLPFEIVAIAVKIVKRG